MPGDFPEAEASYVALKHFIEEFSSNLEEDEVVGCSTNGLTNDFAVQNLTRHGPLISLVGATDEGEFEQVVFTPNSVFFRLFSMKGPNARQPIGFTSG